MNETNIGLSNLKSDQMVLEFVDFVCNVVKIPRINEDCKKVVHADSTSLGGKLYGMIADVILVNRKDISVASIPTFNVLDSSARQDEVSKHICGKTSTLMADRVTKLLNTEERNKRIIK